VLVNPVRQIPGPAGPLETLFDVPAGPPRAAVVFAHPLPTEGGTMHTKVVFQAAKALARIGCVVLRFNFRGVGLSAGAWDNGRGELISLKLVRHFYAQLQEPKELVEIDRANHLFDGQASEVGDALADLLEDFSCRTQ
jgi:alpha/beta superfamily hydrolase